MSGPKVFRGKTGGAVGSSLRRIEGRLHDRGYGVCGFAAVLIVVMGIRLFRGKWGCSNQRK